VYYGSGILSHDVKTVTFSDRTEASRLASQAARLLATDPNLILAGEGRRVEAVMSEAAILLAELRPDAHPVLVESAGRRRAWWWALDGHRDPSATYFTTALWPSVARRQAAAAASPRSARTRAKS
jgi:hypothetical protein